MKFSKNLLTILTIVGAATCGNLATAQEKKDEKPAAPPAGAPPAAAAPRPQAPRDPSAAIARFLNLTDEQKAKVKPILEQEMTDLAAARKDTTLTREAQMAKYKEIRDANTAKIKPILNDEQAQKWDRIRNPRVQAPRPAQPGQPAQPGAPAAPAAPAAK